MESQELETLVWRQSCIYGNRCDPEILQHLSWCHIAAQGTVYALGQVFQDWLHRFSAGTMLGTVEWNRKQCTYTVIKQLQEHSSRHQQHFCMLQKFLSHFSQEKQLCVHSMTTFTASSVQNLIARQCFYYHNDNRNGSLTPNVCVYTCAHSANQCFQHHYLGVAQWNKQTKWNKIHYC